MQDVLSNAATTMANGIVTINYTDTNEMNIALPKDGIFVITLPKKLMSDKAIDLLIGGIIHEGGHARFSLHNDDRGDLLSGLNRDAHAWMVSTLEKANLIPTTERGVWDTNEEYKKNLLVSIERRCFPDAVYIITGKKTKQRTRNAYGFDSTILISKDDMTPETYTIWDKHVHSSVRNLKSKPGYIPNYATGQPVEVKRNTTAPHNPHERAIATIENMFQDIRIEKLMAKQFNNAEMFLSKLNQYCTKTFLQPSIEAAIEKNAIVEPSHPSLLGYCLAQAANADKTFNLDRPEIFTQTAIDIARKVIHFRETCDFTNERKDFETFVNCLKQDSTDNEKTKRDEQLKKEKQKIEKEFEQVEKDSAEAREKLSGAEKIPHVKNKASAEYLDRKLCQREADACTDQEKQAVQNARQELDKAIQATKEITKARSNYARKRNDLQKASEKMAAVESEIKNREESGTALPKQAGQRPSGLIALTGESFKSDVLNIKPRKPRNFDEVLSDFLQRKDTVNAASDNGRINREMLANICTDTHDPDNMYITEDIRPTKTEILIALDTSSSMRGLIERRDHQIKRTNGTDVKSRLCVEVAWELLTACKNKEKEYDLTTKVFLFNNTTRQVPTPKTKEQLDQLVNPYGGTEMANALSAMQTDISVEKETILVFITDVEVGGNEIKTIANNIAGTMTKTIFIPLADTATSAAMTSLLPETDTRNLNILGIKNSDGIISLDDCLQKAANIFERGIE